MSLEPNRITSAKWAAAVSQSQALLVTSDVQLDSNQGIRPSKEERNAVKRWFLFGVQTLIELDPKVLLQFSGFIRNISFYSQGRSAFHASDTIWH